MAKWPLVYPIARSGHRQSPIDIVQKAAVEDRANLRPLQFTYGPDCIKSLVNTGNSWMAEIEDSKTSITA